MKIKNSLLTIHYSLLTILTIFSLSISVNAAVFDHEMKLEEISKKLVEKKFQITINNDMMFNDLQNIYRILYAYNFDLAKAILYFYPADVKIVSDQVEMNNFFNR